MNTGWTIKNFFMMFMQYFTPQVSVKDVIDIIIVAVFLYLFLSLIRGTRAVQIIQGVGVLLGILLISYILNLEALYWLLRYSLITIAVAIPIVFQPELRRALGAIGRGGVFSSLSPALGKEIIAQIADEITWTAIFLSQARIGALIVIEQETGLQEFIETGVQVDGKISSKLLLSIFLPKSPLHDGAVILKGEKVLAASCYLPLSEEVPSSSRSDLGTRHRAAIGISEQSDAIVIVISEQTGTISVARNGKLTKELSEESLKNILISIYSNESSNSRRFARIGGTDVIEIFKKRPGA